MMWDCAAAPAPVRGLLSASGHFARLCQFQLRRPPGTALRNRISALSPGDAAERGAAAAEGGKVATTTRRPDLR